MRTCTPDVGRMLDEGFTKRYATAYLDAMAHERKSGMYEEGLLDWAHAHGFLAESVCAYGVTGDAPEGAEDYLSDYDYYRLWPLNGWQRIWINDKLTLNTLMQGTELVRYIPTYFYYTEQGRLLPLEGSGYLTGMDGLLETLRREGSFACKPCNGALAKGFHLLEYRQGGYLLDGEPITTEGVRQFVESHPNYVITEYLRPEASLAAIHPLIHTIRALVLNPSGCDPTPAMTYLRFGSGVDSVANYVEPTSSEICSFNVHVDIETGAYGDGRLVYANRVVRSLTHPTSGIVAEGAIPEWNGLLEMLRKLALKVGACEYLGFDACMTDKGPKIMEINSHTGIKYLQLFRPALSDPIAGPYFRSRLAALDRLAPEARRARNAIVR